MGFVFWTVLCTHWQSPHSESPHTELCVLCIQLAQHPIEGEDAEKHDASETWCF